jgi:adenylate cyclase class 2
MSAPVAGFETEIKLRIGAAAAQQRLLSSGFAVSRPEIFESNVLYDTPDLSLRTRGCLLRVREAGGECVLTFKGPAQSGDYKAREEIEFGASDAAAARVLFERLGYSPVFRYEKYRTEYQADGVPAVVTVDRTPIGDFVEIEARPEVIDQVATRLGFFRSDYITTSYGKLFLEFQVQNGLHTNDMLFELHGPDSSTSEKIA